MKELWTEVIVLCEIIKQKAEDGHLNAKGLSFYAVHELMDKLKDGLSEKQDGVQELFFGARNIPFVSSNKIIEMVAERIPEESSEITVLAEQIINSIDDLLDVLEKIAMSEETSLGENDFCSSFSKELQQRRYFLNAILK